MNRFLLAAIALGLWANAATVLIRPAHADDNAYWLQSIDSKLSSIDDRLTGTIDVRCTDCR
jgi:hypothetical protein